MVEVPVGYTASIENSFDPSHAQFLHEGSGKFSPQSAIAMSGFERLGEMTAADGFVLRHQGYNTFNQDMEAMRSFRPPCSNLTQYHLPTGGIQTFQLYFVPAAPGYCRYIGKFFADPAPTFNLVYRFSISLLKVLPQDLQIGLQHLGAYKLGDQDITAIYAQEQNKADTARRQPSFLPAPADQGILTWRAWMERFGAGGPASNTPYFEGMETRSDEQLYDRWHRHTKFCPHCRGAVERMAKAQRICQWVAIATVVLGSIAILLLPLQVGLGCLAVAILSILGQQQLVQLRHYFISSLSLHGTPTVKLY